MWHISKKSIDLVNRSYSWYRFELIVNSTRARQPKFLNLISPKMLTWQMTYFYFLRFRNQKCGKADFKYTLFNTFILLYLFKNSYSIYDQLAHWYNTSKFHVMRVFNKDITGFNPLSKITVLLPFPLTISIRT